MNDQKVTSNKCLPRRAQNESCFAQPQPCKTGKKPTVDGSVPRENLSPSEKPNISTASTANGVKSLHEQPLVSTREDITDQPRSTAEGLADQLGPTEQGAQLLEGAQESGPPQPAGKNETPGADKKEKDRETATTRPLEGNAETELLGTEAERPCVRMAGNQTSLGAVEDTASPHAAGGMEPLGPAKAMQPRGTAGELQAPEAVDKDDQFQIPEIVPQENEAPEIPEGSQLGETAEEQQLQATEGKDGQPPLLDTIPRETGTSELSDRSRIMEAAVDADSLHKALEVPGSMGHIQLEGTVGSLEHPAGMIEAETSVELVREIHTNHSQHIEGETGEEIIGTEKEGEDVREGVETKEEETGEAVDCPAAAGRAGIVVE
ncbi:glutamate-rich protein 5 [Echinops telfairi]|uniref:Glutamate-rich protein 5 n=1 Tax=Echinops telfairi TaxID=9371 RepID=A0ABM0IDS6_ECHTE|nr:glutamate-rich protein 5 [Echinops telfairi]